jgi:hypothetical protein
MRKLIVALAMKSVLFVAALLAVGSLASRANATFEWDVKPDTGEPIQAKYSNFEYAIDTDGSQGFGVGTIVALPDSVGDEIRGIFRITTIANLASTITFWQPTAGVDELTGSFAGYLVTAISPDGTDFDFMGGFLKIFYDDFSGGGTAFDSTFTAVPTVDPLAVGHGNGFADGTLWLDTIGAVGILTPPGTTTLHSDFTVTTSPFTGHSAGYLEIVGGSQAAFFSKEFFDKLGLIPGSQDLLLESDAKSPSNALSPGLPTDWPVSSQDPVTGAFVPEPTTMAVWAGLFGGAAGLGFIRRRKKAKAEQNSAA